jgi:hypothetical protein
MSTPDPVAYLQAELSSLRDLHNEFVNDILERAPRCWDGDAAAVSIAVHYVRGLEQATQDGHTVVWQDRHTDGCDGKC